MIGALGLKPSDKDLGPRVHLQGDARRIIGFGQGPTKGVFVIRLGDPCETPPSSPRGEGAGVHSP